MARVTATAAMATADPEGAVQTAAGADGQETSATATAVLAGEIVVFGDVLCNSGYICGYI